MDKNELMLYQLYHQDPLNKFLHFVCIPIISYSILVFSSKYQLKIIDLLSQKIKVNMCFDELIVLFYNIYYLTYGFKIGFYMFMYNTFLYAISRAIYSHYPTNDKENFMIFLAAFTLQFIGHYIEGSRPAMFVGLKQTLLQAPLFNLNYIYPNLLNN